MRIVVIDTTKPPDLRKSSPRILWPVTADFRARLLERFEVQGERRRLVHALRIPYTSLEQIITGRVVSSAYVARISEYYRWEPSPT